MNGRASAGPGRTSSVIAAWVCHLLVTLPMLGAGIGKAFHLAPERVMTMFATTYHLAWPDP